MFRFNCLERLCLATFKAVVRFAKTIRLGPVAQKKNSSWKNSHQIEQDISVAPHTIQGFTDSWQFVMIGNNRLSKLQRSQTKQTGMKCKRYTFAGSVKMLAFHTFAIIYLISMLFFRTWNPKVWLGLVDTAGVPSQILGYNQATFFPRCQVVKKWHSQGFAGHWCSGASSQKIDFCHPKITCGGICFKDAG